MEKMRWFIIGNLIGFGVLIVGIGINESIKQKAAEPTTDKQSVQSIDQQSGSQTKQTSNASSAATSAVLEQSASPASATSAASGTENVLKTEARLVTTRDINKGTILHAGDIELKQVDARRANKDGLTKFDMALGFKTRIDLIEGEMLEPSDLETRETE